MHQDEYLDLVNDSDEVIGKKLRGEVYAENLSNFRVVNVFLVNSDGKLWIPRRTATKRIFPLCLDMSMGGHVKSEETYEQAFKRELLEELGIDADKTPWKLLDHLTPHENKVSAFMNVYEIKVAEAPIFNSEDFVEYYWLTPNELFVRIDAGEKTKEDLPKLVNHFYPSRFKNADTLANAAMDRGFKS
jgi:isopentenyl-diphosphate delta-isomerase